MSYETVMALSNAQKAAVWAYANNDMNVTAAAEELYVHRNTAVYHLRQVKAKTGLDPCCFYDLVELIACLDGEDDDA